MESVQMIGIDLPLKGTGLAGHRGQHLGFIQRSDMAGSAARVGPR